MQLSSIFAKESLFYFLFDKYFINVGVDDSYLNLYNESDVCTSFEFFKNENYKIIPFKKSFHIILLKDASAEDELKSFIICVEAINNRSNEKNVYSIENIERCYEFVKNEWNSFYKLLYEYGYNVNHIVLGVKPHRWNVIRKDE